MILKIYNRSLTTKEWSQISGVNRRTIESRLKKGMSPIEAVFSPPHGHWEKVDGHKRESSDTV